MRTKTTIKSAIGIILMASMAFVFAHGVADRDAAFIEQNPGQALVIFMYLGAKHMITGYDHILYLLGVIFFLYRLRDVTIFVTLFAVGHSITLLTGVLGSIHVNTYLIDAVIGLSVAYKALENLDGLKKLLGFNPNPKLAVFSFGLIHGFGLATKLQEMTLSDNGIVGNIIAFNIGVELGQVLALIVMLFFINAWRVSGGFERYAKNFNFGLMFAGVTLAGYQIYAYSLS